MPTLALVAALLTALAQIGWSATGWPRGPFTAAAILGWGIAGFLAFRANPELLRELGLRRDNLRATAPWYAVVFSAGAAGLLAWGFGWGAAEWPPLAFVTLAFYPLWGLIQQGILQGVVVRGLEGVPGLADRPAWVTLLAAALFGAAHLSHPALVLPTFALALVAVPLFRRAPNLWWLGLAHGWLGTILFTWVLGREPVSEFFLGG